VKKSITIITVIIIITIICIGWWGSQLKSVSSEKVARAVTIEKGKSVSQIAKQLEEEKLIRSAFAFSWYIRIKGLSSKISAGRFKLSPDMTADEIVNILSSKPAEQWITLVEGLRVEEMAEKLNSQFRILASRSEQNSEFLQLAKEGYMFPDTYLFPEEVTAEQVVKKLRDTFNLKYSEELRAKIRLQGLTDDEGIILASIVEREARSDKARTEVASILLRRLKIDMGLNADATIQYALGYQAAEKSWWKRHLTREDLKIVSPYNTYLYKGLPPTPISNPGLASITAVANADPSTPYLYYYHDSKGNSYYAKTLEEHNQNVANSP